MNPESDIGEILEVAAHAVAHARSVRKHHARRTAWDSVQRKTDIKVALQTLKEAMKPVRHEICRLPYQVKDRRAEFLREASEAIQRERRKLWKMTKPRTRRN